MSNSTLFLIFMLAIWAGFLVQDMRREPETTGARRNRMTSDTGGWDDGDGDGGDD